MILILSSKTVNMNILYVKNGRLLLFLVSNMMKYLEVKSKNYFYSIYQYLKLPGSQIIY